MTTKADKITAHLRVYKSITQQEANDFYKHTRLAGHIIRLRAKGWRIDTELIPTADGVSKYGRYHLISEVK